MKLKTVLLAGLIVSASAISAFAQTVYSVNAVGFVNITVPTASFQIICNPLNASSNNLPTLLPNAPTGVVVYKFVVSSQGFSTYTKSSRGWSGNGIDGKNQDTAIFNPGEAFFVYNPNGSDAVLTFVGEIPQGVGLPITIPPAFSMLAPHVPQTGKLETDLKLQALNGDVVYFYRTGNYQSATKSSRGWSGPGVDASGEPKPGVGEGFFYFSTAGGNRTWSRDFSANN